MVVYRSLLRLCPREFRGEFGDDMARNVEDALRDCASRGERARVFAAAVFDLFTTAASERTGWISDGLARKNTQRRMYMEIIGDLRFALRSLRRRPAFLLATVLTLALGIGA